MRIALIADIHGNLPALEAVLAEIAAEPIDRIVCLGDVASLGPQPREVLARLRALGCPVVMGNTDAEVLDPAAPHDAPDEDARRIREINAWTAGLLSEEDKAYLRSFQPTVAVDLGDGATLLCYHGSPRSFNDRLMPDTPHDTLDAWFADHPAAALYAGGHTHNQMLVRHGKALVLNPGSVGLPFDTVPPGAGTRNPAWAEYAVVESDGGQVRVEFRRTPFDVAALLRAARESGMPHADWWSADWDMPSRDRLDA
jgi:predicted phosphodiesterase